MPAPPPVAPPALPAAVEGVALRFQHPEPPPLEEVAAYYRLADEAAYYANGGPCARLLEARLSERLGGAHCVTVASGTAGLLVALRALFGPPAPGRVVVTPSFTFAATACAIEWAGFRPLFVDVEPTTWQLDPAGLEAALADGRHDVAGVLACSTFGSPPPAWMRRSWRASCRAHGAPLMIDSAAAFGSVDDEGRPSGGAGDTELFSFHATKPFAVGEGGLLATPDAALAERMRALCNFGMEPGTRVAAEVGINGKMSELAAATALAMLDRYPAALAERRATAAALRGAIHPRALVFQRGAEGSTWQILQGLAPTPAHREAALRAAARLGVQARSYFDPPLHRHPAFAGAPRADGLRVTEAIASRSLSLPMANRLDGGEVALVARVVEEAIPC
ncbi:DegT/DnrJ/EryC1/StrS family aminotransferase [Miltoncostaea marina]|uniref:DegT/DnrJ/EryC1/StrS family aminotransferase n=1 Tax=Miltoncostaea marina TaxID=2843215 RepID=UPI001C3DB595|nr:DegT/DnrJ/EryC1/StrS aminotransferase family protein [Miltoncostaea marina]